MELQDVKNKLIQEGANVLLKLMEVRYPDKEIHEIKVRRIKGNSDNPVIVEIIDSEYKGIDKGC